MQIDPRIAEYEYMRTLMRDNDVPIPDHVLRRYLDALREYKHKAVGEYYTKRLVVTGQFLNQHLDIARGVLGEAIEVGFIIVVDKQPWRGEI